MSNCHCAACDPYLPDLSNMRMIVCSICGNKRCPRAADHRNACTNSNEPGQVESPAPTPPSSQSGGAAASSGNSVLLTPEDWQEAASIISSLRDFIAEGGSSRMIGATQAIIDADAFCDKIHEALAARSARAGTPGPAGTPQGETCAVCGGSGDRPTPVVGWHYVCGTCNGSGRSPTTRPERQHNE